MNKWIATLLLGVLTTLPVFAQEKKQEYSLETRKTEKAETKKSPAEKRQQLEQTPKGREAQMREVKKLYDRDGDSRLDKYEIKSKGRDQSLKWDLNGDGRLDQYELKAMRKALAAQNPKAEAVSETRKAQKKTERE